MENVNGSTIARTPQRNTTAAERTNHRLIRLGGIFKSSASGELSMFAGTLHRPESVDQHFTAAAGCGGQKTRQDSQNRRCQFRPRLTNLVYDNQGLANEGDKPADW